MTAATAIFSVSCFALLHTYALYPLILRVLRTASAQPHLGSDSHEAELDVTQTPRVSVIIPFHNEERWVARKLENTLSCDYPADRLEVIAVSDGSVDATNDILESYKSRIQVLAYHPRQGKA